ncbi:winged helix-turn-helix transcriptional regulator [Yaniella flava]|uniref:Winged helix-turn-helix transcriptional regulator n=1 Tax=Yaniella flava TaxID=287930 RepID=A0ABP5FJX8_9MICC|nr:helix-turn-helix transcriptional regulator [Micrococcaceae bacterium]
MSKDYGQFCGLAKAASVLGERWALLLVRDLSISPRRFKELHDGLPGIPTSVLTTRLRELETAGIAQRQIAGPTQAGVVYGLTAYGKQLGPVLDALGRWGAQRMSTPEPDDVITSASLAAALRSGYQPDVLTSLTTYELHAGPAIAWARAHGGQIEVGAGAPDFTADVTILAGPQLRLLLAGHMSASEAIASGAAEVTGPDGALATFSRAFHVPLDDFETVTDTS